MPGVAGEVGTDDAAQPEKCVHVTQRGVSSPLQGPEERGPNREKQQHSKHGGDKKLCPWGRIKQSSDKAAHAAEGKHQKREIDGQHLNDDEDENEREPKDPRVIVNEFAGQLAAPLSVILAYDATPRRKRGVRRLGSVGVVSNPLKTGSPAGKRALVTGSSRGIGADTIGYFAEAGATVVVNYRNKEARALKLVTSIEQAGGTATAIGADLTDAESVTALFNTVEETLGGLDILVMNASGGMESGMAADYAMQLNRDAQVNLLTTALPLLAPGARVVFVTSHQAHFINTVETMPEYVPVALSKRAGEDALRDLIPTLAEKGIEFVVVSGDMIEGTITATLLERANPGAIGARKEAAGRLYNVSEFAAEVALAAVEPVPANNTRYVGDVSDFLGE